MALRYSGVDNGAAKMIVITMDHVAISRQSMFYLHSERRVLVQILENGDHESCRVEC